MRKIFLISFLLYSLAGLSQNLQYGDWYFRGGSRLGINKPTNNLHPNSSFEVNDSSTGSLFRIYKNGGILSYKLKNNSAEDSILITDQFGNFKLKIKPSNTIPWDNIIGKPFNYPTTYALSNDLRDSIQKKQNIIYANVRDYGALGDGVTDDRAAFVNAFASGLPVLVPVGKFYLSATLTLTKYQTIKGVGDSSIITLGTGNYPAFTIEGDYINISNLTVRGQGRGTATNYETTRPNQHGVYLLGANNTPLARSGISVDNCRFDSLGGSGVYITTNRMPNWANGVSVTNNFAINCFAGFTTGNRGEYNTFVNNSASDCEYGVWNQGGNNSFVGGVLTDNRTNFYLKKGDNDAHSTASNVTINHALDIGIMVDSIGVGWQFDGCNIWQNKIVVVGATGVVFSDCQFGTVSEVLFAGSTKCAFNNSRWRTTPTFNLSYLGSASDVKFFGNNWEATPAANIFNSVQNQLVIPVTANKLVKVDTISRVMPTSLENPTNNLLTLNTQTFPWDTAQVVFNYGSAALHSLPNSYSAYSVNRYINQAGQSIYQRDGSIASLLISQASGSFQFFQAPAGLAGNTATVTAKMILAGNGNLLVGGTTNNNQDIIQATGSGIFQNSAQNLQLRLGILSPGISPILRLQGRPTGGSTNRFADIQLDADNNQLSLIAPATATASLTNKLLNLTSDGRVLIGTQTNNLNQLVQVNGSGIFSTHLTAQRARFTSLVLNKDSIPINTNQIWFYTSDTTGAAGSNLTGRRNLSNVLTASISFDTTTRELTIPTLSGGSSSVVIPRGSASGTSGITALSSSRIGNLVTVSGDNGSTTTFSVRDADSTATLSDLTAGNGLSGTAYNGSTPITWTVDTTIISTKNNVDALLFGYAKLTGADFTGSVSIGTNAVSDSSKVIGQTMATNDGWSIFGTGEENKGEMVFKVGDDGLPYYLGGQRFRFSYSNLSGGSAKEVLIVDYDTITTPNTIYAQKYSVIGGTSSQFQKGDGSLDNNTYLTAADISGKLDKADTTAMLSNYARLSGADFTGGIGFAGNLTATAGNRTLTIDNITNFGQSLLLNSAGSLPLVLQTNGTTALTINSGQEVNTVSSITANSFLKSAGLIQPISLKTANYTLTNNDHTVVFDVSGGNKTATLPAGVEGQIFVIKLKGSSSNNVTITPNGSNTIEDNSSWTLFASGCGNTAYTIKFLGGNWEIISSYLPPCL